MNGCEEISWSTAAVQPKARLAAWTNFIAETFRQCDMDFSAEDDFWATITSARFGDINIAKIGGSPRKGVRTVEASKHTKDGVTLSISCRGRYRLAQARHDMPLRPGAAHFYHNCLPGTFESFEEGDYWLISLPARMIVPAYGDSSALIGCRIDHSKPELRLLVAYIDAVFQTPGLHDGKTREVIGDQVTSLVVAAVGRVHEEAEAAAGRGVRATRYKLMLDEIRRRYREPTLNGERLAKALGVSGRYVQQLFEENGQTVSCTINAERLRAARRMLADPRCDHMKLVDIAYECGFSDQSCFNRAFRSKYGETPTAARASA